MTRLPILLLLPSLVYGMASFPPADMTCAPSPFPNPSTEYVRCKFPPHISKFVTSDSDLTFPSALLVPKTGKVKLKAHFNGYIANPFQNCDDWNFSDPNYIVTKNCPTPTTDNQIDWGGPSHGELAYSWRIAATVKYAQDHYADRIDWPAGLTFSGCSVGGTTALLQSVLMPEPFTQALITVVDACTPHTLFVKQSPPVGQYWKDANVRRAWGAFDWTQADIRTQATGRIYYKVTGSPADTSVVFDTAFFSEVCDAGIPCFGLWHNCGHTKSCSQNLPWNSTYTDSDMSHRLDQPQIAFIHSTANSPLDAPVGHWNLGLAWRDGGVNNKTLTIIPLRYLQHTGIGGGVPDQPASVTFGVVLRNLKLNVKAGDTVYWTLPPQSGYAVAENGKITINGLTLNTSAAYSMLTLTRVK